MPQKIVLKTRNFGHTGSQSTVSGDEIEMSTKNREKYYGVQQIGNS